MSWYYVVGGLLIVGGAAVMVWLIVTDVKERRHIRQTLVDDSITSTTGWCYNREPHDAHDICPGTGNDGQPGSFQLCGQEEVHGPHAHGEMMESWCSGVKAVHLKLVRPKGTAVLVVQGSHVEVYGPYDEVEAQEVLARVMEDLADDQTTFFTTTLNEYQVDGL